MEIFKVSNGRVSFFGILLAFSLLLGSAKGFDKEDPVHNVNLPPFIRWLSAYYCIKNNVSDVCPPAYRLKEGGWLNVSASDTQEFCKAGGCADHTRQVLACIHDVFPHYWFANKATVKDLQDTINIGCAQGFNGTSFYPHAKKH